MKIKNMKQVKKHVKDMSTKRLSRKNQIIITALAIIITVAEYLNYAGKKDLIDNNRAYEAGAMDISDGGILVKNQAVSLNGQTGLQEIPSPDQDPSDLDATSDTDGIQAAVDTGADQGQLIRAGDGTGVEGATQTADPRQMAVTDTDSSVQAGLENPGEAMLTSGINVTDYVANVQLNREQVRTKSKGTLMSLISSDSIDEAVKQQAIQDTVDLTEASEEENAAETLLAAKSLSDPVVSVAGDKMDVIVNTPSITNPQRAQTKDIVKRGTEVGADQAIITLLNTAE